MPFIFSCFIFPSPSSVGICFDFSISSRNWDRSTRISTRPLLSVCFLSLSLHYWFVIVSIVAYHKYLIATSLRSLIFLHSTQLTHNVWALSGRIVDWECTENLDRHPKNSSSTIFRVSKWSAGSGAAVLWPHELRAAYYFSYLRKKKKTERCLSWFITNVAKYRSSWKEAKAVVTGIYESKKLAESDQYFNISRLWLELRWMSTFWYLSDRMFSCSC